jgi:hypothetical protein
MRHAGRGAAFGIEQQEGKALRAVRRVRPGERRRDVLADAIRASLLVAARIFYRQVPLSWIAGEVSVNTSAARATGTAKMDTTANTPDVARTAIVRFMTFPSLVFSKSAR